MDDLGLNCTVCEEYFSNERPPKNLTCGHSVCATCANKILSADKKCPECRQVIKASSISEMPINQPLLKLALSLIHGKVTSSYSRPPKPIPSSEPHSSTGVFNTSRSVVDVGECQDHGNRHLFRCMSCKTWICDTCVLSNHCAPPEGQCRTLPLVQALQEMKLEYLGSSTSKILFAQKLKRRLEKETTVLDGIRQQKSRALSSLQSLLQEAEIIVAVCDAQSEETSGRVLALQELLDNLKTKKESLKRISNFDESQCVLKEAEDVLAEVEKQVLLAQHHHSFRIPVLKSLSKQNLRGLLETVEKGIFVSHFSESNEQRWAKITERDGILHLHALDTLQECPNGLILPYEVVRNMVPIESPSLFMDIAYGGHIKGRVYVKMFGNTVRSQQALYLCSGEKGPSYKGTCFFKVDHVNTDLEILRGGDYTNNDGTGGCAILHGITSGGVYKSEIVAGLMVGWPVNDYWRLGTFDFYLRSCKGRCDNSGYGIVTYGIEVLRSAARRNPISDSVVKSCGLVIPM